MQIWVVHIGRVSGFFRVIFVFWFFWFRGFSFCFFLFVCFFFRFSGVPGLKGPQLGEAEGFSGPRGVGLDSRKS